MFTRPSGEGAPGIAGKFIAAFVAGASSPRSSRGERLGAISVPFVTQPTNATVSALMVSASGFGFAGRTQPLGGAGAALLKPPRPPPCDVPGQKERRTLAGGGIW